MLPIEPVFIHYSYVCINDRSGTSLQRTPAGPIVAGPTSLHTRDRLRGRHHTLDKDRYRHAMRDGHTRGESEELRPGLQ